MAATSFDVTVNGATAKYKLRDGWNKVSVNFGGGAAGTVTPRYYPSPTSQPSAVNIPAPVSAVSTTVNTDFDISGGGDIDFNIAGIAGTISITIYPLYQ
jgi:hypothetical protein